MDHLWIINGSYGGCADKIVGTGEIFRKEKMTNEGIVIGNGIAGMSAAIEAQNLMMKYFSITGSVRTYTVSYGSRRNQCSS